MSIWLKRCVLFMFFSCISALTLLAQCRLELFPQTKSIGINVILNPGDPEKDCYATLTFTTTPGSKPIEFEGFPLARVNNRHNRLSGGIFYIPLFSDKVDKVKVVLHDATTPALDGVLLEGSAQFSYPPSANPNYKIWVVAPEGAGNQFTTEAPGNLKDALTQIDSNARIELKPGTYYLRNFRWVNKHNIILVSTNSTGSEETVISGLDTAQLQWQPYGNSGIYVTTTTIANPNLVYHDSIRLFPFRSLDEMNRNKLGIGFNSLAQPVEFDANMDGFFRNPSTNPLCNSNWQYPRLLYVKLRDGANPAGKNIRITAAGYAFSLENCENIFFSGIKFTGYGVSPSAHAVELKDCDRISFTLCTFAMNDVGIQLTGTTSHTYIRDCEFFDGNFDWSAWKIKATYDDYHPYSCMFPYYSRLLERGAINISHGFSGRGLDIGYSSFHDYAQAGHLSPPSVNDAFEDSYEIDFHHNRVYRCFEDGFEIDGDARGIRVFENDFDNINAPLSLAVAKGGPTYIYRNIFRNLKSDTFTTHPDLGLQVTPGHPFKTNYGSGDTMGEVNFIHNTLDMKGGNTGLDFFSPCNWQIFRVWNNIVVADSGYLLQIRTPYRSLPNIKGNLFYSTSNNPRYLIDTNYQDAQQFRTGDYADFINLFKNMNPQVDANHIMAYGNPMFEGGESEPFGAYHLQHGVSPGLGWPAIPGFSGEWYDYFGAIGAVWQGLPEGVAPINPYSQTLYPNPNRGELNWNYIETNIQSVRIFNLQGKELFSSEIFPNQYKVNHPLPNGIYVVHLIGEGVKFTSKMVVVR